MRTDDKLDFDFYQKDGRYWWVDVTIKPHGHDRSARSFTPSFEDIWQILLCISWCEFEKYKDRVKDPIKKITTFLLYGQDATRELLQDKKIDHERFEKRWHELSKAADLPDRTREPSLFSMSRKNYR